MPSFLLLLTFFKVLPEKPPVCLSINHRRLNFMKNEDTMFRNMIVMLCFIMMSIASCSNDSSSDGAAPGGGTTAVYRIDHTALNADDIPAAVITQIKALDVYFEHASVGGNVVDGLAIMAADASLRYTHNAQSWSFDDGTVDSAVSNWYASNNGFGDNMRGNPSFADKLSRFNSRIRTSGFASLIDVASFKFCYIDNNYSGTAQEAFDSVRTVMEGLESDYPNVTFFWWTMPLTTSGDQARDGYNALVRAYCAAHNKYLLDIADIECHNPAGIKQTDASGHELLFDVYSTDGGHLDKNNSNVRVALAYWVLLARITGWDGVSQN
jgi:hypothetical protein